MITKSKGIAYLLWLPSLVGIAGLHRMYLGKIGTGILWLCTCGMFGVGSLIDLFTLGEQVSSFNAQQELAELRSVSTANAKAVNAHLNSRQ